MKYPSECKLERACSPGQGHYAMHAANLHVWEDEGGEFKGELVATDGKILAIVAVEPEPDDTDGPVTVEAIKAARKPAYRETGTRTARISANGGLVIGASVREGECMTLPRPEVGDFPRYQAVLPKDDPYLRVGLDATLLHKLADAIGVTEGGVVLEIPEPVKGQITGPIKVVPIGAARGYGVIMPVVVS